VTSEDIAGAVFAALAALDVPFMLSGSLASNFYGVPRATQDADIVLELYRLPLEPFAQRLGDDFTIDPQIAFETVTGSRRLLVTARATAFRVELFDLTTDPHDRERFARRRPVDVFGHRVAVPTAEDVILNKLRWWKIAGRRKDLEDARNVLIVQQSALDRSYLEKWADTLGVRTILDDMTPPGQSLQ
jgi:hypothetical protein